MKFCHDAALGMHYLTTQNVIHRDFAARNCLLETKEMRNSHKGRQAVTQGVNLRIADFSLSRHVDEAFGDYDKYE